MTLENLEKELKIAITLEPSKKIPSKKEFRISELVHCPRKAVYLRKVKMDIPVNGMMLNGTMFHERLPRYLKRLKGFKDAQFECPVNYTSRKGFYINGHADVVTEDCVYEFKYSMAKVNVPTYFYNQANMYAHLLEKPKYRIVIVNPFKLDVMVLEGQTDKGLVNIILDRAEEIYNNLNNKGDMPDGPLKEDECKYCPFIKECYRENKDLPEKMIRYAEKE